MFAVLTLLPSHKHSFWCLCVSAFVRLRQAVLFCRFFKNGSYMGSIKLCFIVLYCTVLYKKERERERERERQRQRDRETERERQRQSERDGGGWGGGGGGGSKLSYQQFPISQSQTCWRLNAIFFYLAKAHQYSYKTGIKIQVHAKKRNLKGSGFPFCQLTHLYYKALKIFW